jgi:putative salt-induced outer membrane protein YdiY
VGGQYNLGHLKNGIKFLGTDFSKLTDYRYQGWMVGGGIGYGYDWILGRHWNLELEIGVGYVYTRYDRFECTECGKKIEEDKPHHYFGPTKAAVNLVYVF